MEDLKGRIAVGRVMLNKCAVQGVAIWQLVTGAAVLSPLCISMLWAIYNAIPPYLIIHFALFGRVSFPDLPLVPNEDPAAFL